jgi:hypothetical protein
MSPADHAEACFRAREAPAAGAGDDMTDERVAFEA